MFVKAKASGMGFLINVYSLAVGLGAVGVIAATPTAEAACTWNVATCQGSCYINAGLCMTGCTTTINAGGCTNGHCTVNVLASCDSGGFCGVNVLAWCLSGAGCTVNVLTGSPFVGQCTGGYCGVNVAAPCHGGGSCLVNVVGECYGGSCLVNVGLCMSGCTTTVNAGGCTDGHCDVNVLASCDANGACETNALVANCLYGGTCTVNAALSTCNDPNYHCVVNVASDCYQTCDTMVANVCADPWELLPDYGSMIRATIAVPERVWISDSYSIGAYIQNNENTPHLVSVEAFPTNSDLCSVASSGTSSSGTQVREHEYLLLANGTPQLEVPDLASPDGSTGVGLGDFAVLEVGIKPNAPGQCEIVIMVTVDALFEKHWLVSTEVDLPPPVAALGRFVETNGCTRSAAPASPPTTVTVAAGRVDVLAQLDYWENCVDDDASGALVVEQLVGSTWVPVAGGTAEDTGSSEIRATSPLSLAAGTHTFRVGMAVWKDVLTWGCLSSLAVAVGTILAPLAFGGPIGAAALASLILFAIGAAIALGFTCGEMYHEYHTVTVQAVSAEPAGTALTLLSSLGDQLGDEVDELDP